MPTPNIATTNKLTKSTNKSLTVNSTVKKQKKKKPTKNHQIQSVSCVVFKDSEMDDEFETTKRKNRQTSSVSSTKFDGQKANKKNSMFVTANRFYHQIVSNSLQHYQM